MKLTSFAALTMDCYGTLIDWETGILEALRPWTTKHRIMASNDALLEQFGRLEAEEEERTPAKRYSELLATVHGRLARHFDVAEDAGAAQAFGQSIRDWPVFADTAAALKYLHGSYKLIVLSNVDRASFAFSHAKLGVTLDAVITAEDVGSYKPSLRNFEYALDKLRAMGIAKERILHTAQSLFHDIKPAKAMGLATMWINRRHDKPGAGATPDVADLPRPDFVATSMADFVRQHQAELAAARR